jgi:hypothetical protein
MGFPLSVLCSRHPKEIGKTHTLAPATDIVFCNFKSLFPLKLKIKYQRFNEKGRPFEWYHLTLAPVNSCWTIALSKKIGGFLSFFKFLCYSTVD